jgi:hypothetical protein
VTPTRRRARAVWMQETFQITVCRACRLAGYSRAAWYKPRRTKDQSALRLRIRELAMARPRFGDQRIHMLREVSGWKMSADLRQVARSTKATSIRTDASISSAEVLPVYVQSMRALLRSPQRRFATVAFLLLAATAISCRDRTPTETLQLFAGKPMSVCYTGGSGNCICFPGTYGVWPNCAQQPETTVVRGRISLTCNTQSPLVRASELSCRAVADSDSVRGMRFVSVRQDTVNLDSIARPDTNVWRGTVVISGDVYAWGARDTARVPVRVVARHWSSQDISAGIVRVPQHWPGLAGDTTGIDLPDHPTAINGQMGMTSQRLSNAPSNTVPVPDGPNRGLIYIAAIPSTIANYVAINDIAMSDSSGFWLAQGARIDTVRYGGASRIFCSRSSVSILAALVREHEGLAAERDSHVSIFTDSVVAYLRRNAEGFVLNPFRPGTESFPRLVADAFSYGIKYSGQLDLPTGSPYRNALTLPSPGRGLPCTYFRFE